MFCTKCGKTLTEEDLFCPACGTKNKLAWNETVSENKTEKVTENNVTTVTQKATKPQNEFIKANRKPIGILLAVLIIFMGIGAVKLYNNYKTERLWKEYMTAKNSSSYSTGKSSGRIDYSSLHNYADGTYKVGVDIPAGEYVLFATSGSGYFAVTSDSSGDDILFNDNFTYNSIITIRDGEYLELSRCYAEKITMAGDLKTTGEGMFKIGKHLPAGEYKLKPTSSDYSGYYCVYNDSRHDDIDDNDNFSGSAYVTVRNGQYLTLSRCYITN